MFTNTTTRTSIVRTAIVAVAVLAVGALGNSVYAGDSDSSWALQHSKVSGVARMDRAGKNVTPTQTGRVNYYTSFGDGQTVARIDAINSDGRVATPVQTGRVLYYTSFGDGQTVARIDAINNDSTVLAQRNQYRPASVPTYAVTPSPAAQAYDGTLAGAPQSSSSM